MAGVVLKLLVHVVLGCETELVLYEYGDGVVVLLQVSVMVLTVTTVSMAVEVAFLVTGHRVTLLLCGHRVRYEPSISPVSSAFIRLHTGEKSSRSYLLHDAADAMLHIPSSEQQ